MNSLFIIYFLRLYKSDFSSDLLSYWQKCGDYSLVATKYTAKLDLFANSEGMTKDELFDQTKKVAIFLEQAGQYEQAYPLLEQCVDLVVNDLGGLPEVIFLFIFHEGKFMTSPSTKSRFRRVSD